MKLIYIIDATGKWLEDKVVNDNYQVKANEIDSKINPTPQGLILPKWNGSKWIEGGAAVPSNLPDYNGFLLAYMESSIDKKIDGTNNKRASRRLDIAFKQPINLAILKASWNLAIASLPQALTAAEVTQLNNWKTQFNLPWSFGADGAMV